MYFLQIKNFSWKELLLGSEDWIFLPEVIIRTLVMFLVVLISLSILGKRGVKQLSVFELVVIIGLGSAAGDPMFYKDVGLIPAIMVFIIIIGLYSFVTHWVGKSKKLERLIEGSPVCLIKEGRFAIDNFSKEALGQDEFFAELRLKAVSHLGQVENAIIETNGGISLFFYPDEEVKYGLPVMPESLDKQVIKINKAGFYSCIFCGFTKESEPVAQLICTICKKDRWIESSNKKRIG